MYIIIVGIPHTETGIAHIIMGTITTPIIVLRTIQVGIQDTLRGITVVIIILGMVLILHIIILMGIMVTIVITLMEEEIPEDIKITELDLQQDIQIEIMLEA